jgi:hypothetical protein
MFVTAMMNVLDLEMVLVAPLEEIMGGEPGQPVHHAASVPATSLWEGARRWDLSFDVSMVEQVP